MARTRRKTLVVKDTHRGLWYEDGVLVRIIEAGRYTVPGDGWRPWPGRRRVEVTLVDVRERELTIKGQEILTKDKVAVRVSIIVQFQVSDPKAAVHAVQNYEERLYSDVQLAARQSLAGMTLEEILTNRNRLSEEILADLKEVAARYGVAILRADVKDLIFPGNLQEIMNRVLTAERLSQAQLVDARTKAQVQEIEARAHAEAQRLAVSQRAETERIQAESHATVRAIQAAAEVAAAQEKAKIAETYEAHPSLLRIAELEALRDLGGSANARLFINFDRNAAMTTLLDRSEGAS
jgi:regulator of protease activity HflC (stomatin/prohibitin superfamily)